MNYNFRSILFCLLIVVPFTISAKSEEEKLSPTEYSIARIAASTATGELETLKEALNEGLENGLSINKIKEELVHLYAYTGFPRSLMAINTLTEQHLETRNQEMSTGKALATHPYGRKWKLFPNTRAMCLK